jgi:hypothetical protein
LEPPRRKQSWGFGEPGKQKEYSFPCGSAIMLSLLVTGVSNVAEHSCRRNSGARRKWLAGGIFDVTPLHQNSDPPPPGEEGQETKCCIANNLRLPCLLHGIPTVFYTVPWRKTGHVLLTDIKMPLFPLVDVEWYAVKSSRLLDFMHEYIQEQFVFQLIT